MRCEPVSDQVQKEQKTADFRIQRSHLPGNRHRVWLPHTNGIRNVERVSFAHSAHIPLWDECIASPDNVFLQIRSPGCDQYGSAYSTTFER